MGEIHAHEFMTADGVIESPSWTFEYGFDPGMGEMIAELTGRSRGILLGRVTYEMFGPAWSTRTAEDDPGAPFFNDTTKYVVSSTLSDPGWGPAEVIAYDAVRELKDRVDGDIFVSGSATLVRALLADGLLDGLHLCVFPLTLGTGLRLFNEGDAPAKLTLAGSDTYPNGVVYLNYERG